MTPNKKNITKWINALRSGRYKQTKYTLQDAGGYCCLGVACDVFIKPKLRELNKDKHLCGSYPMSQSNAPLWLKLINGHFAKLASAEFADLNDYEGMTFDEIADLLQLVYIEEAL